MVVLGAHETMVVAVSIVVELGTLRQEVQGTRRGESRLHRWPRGQRDEPSVFPVRRVVVVGAVAIKAQLTPAGVRGRAGTRIKANIQEEMKDGECRTKRPDLMEEQPWAAGKGGEAA